MSQQWLHVWFPVVALFLQVIFWSLYISLHASSHTIALLSFTRDPYDPHW